MSKKGTDRRICLPLFTPLCRETVVEELTSSFVYTQIKVTCTMNIHTGNRTASLKLGGTESKCARCGKTVYFAEQVFGAGKKWHKQCLKCVACNKIVNSSTMRDKDGKENNHFIAKGVNVLFYKIIHIPPIEHLPPPIHPAYCHRNTRSGPFSLLTVFAFESHPSPSGISNNSVPQPLGVGVYGYFTKAM